MARQRKVAAIVGRNTEYTKQFVASGREEPPAKTAPTAAAGREAEQSKPPPPVNEPTSKPARASHRPRRAAATTEVNAEPAAAIDAGPGGAVRTVNLVAYPKLEHEEDLLRLEGQGFPIMDMVKLAGKRASKRFAPDRTYVPAPDAPRLPRNRAFSTSKRIEAALIEALRQGHDPLGIKSADTLLRGQFEPVFWAELDALIAELSK